MNTCHCSGSDMELLESDLHFVTKPSQDYFCPVCTEILTDPHLSDCGHHLCGSCRDRLLAGNKAECPECREPDLLKSARLNKHLQRQVKDLVVYCSHHEEGCKWKGELRNLQEHLDPTKRRCGYVRVPCSFQCGELVRSGAVKEHKRSHCRKRPYTCKYCGYHNALDVVTERHMPACRQFPVDCPNNCETNGLKRHHLQSHIKQCPLEIVPCSFSSIGCTARLPRKEIEAHKKQALHQHLELVLKAIEPKQEETATIVTLPPLDTLYLVNLPPVKFTIMDYVERKLAGEEWVSPPFYSHPQGYKMCLEVASTNDQENMSMYVHVLQGEYDDELIWPFEGRVSVDLVNWKEDKGHHEENFDINILTTRDYSMVHVSKNDSRSIAGKPHFIPHSSLSYDPASNTEYLHDDCLCVRVKSVDVYSTHLVHKTPAWQDSQLTPSMPPPLCEFTLAEFSKRKQFNNRFYSPLFHVHPHGHEMCIVVDANGIRNMSKGSHTSVFVAPVTKNNSPTLQPFECDVVIELLNWKEDKEHFIRTISLNSGCLFFYDNTIGTSMIRRRFIQHSLLPFDPATNTEYLQDDCLRMRVKSVDFYSNDSSTCSSSEQSSLLEVTLTEFSKRKQFGNIFYTSPFYSHPQGYKLCLRCDANGSEKTHLSVFGYLMRGEHDDHLHWPCDCSVGIELVNWREDKGHMLKWTSLVYSRVIDLDIADNGSGWSQFVSHASLTYDPATNTEYLHDDSLRLRVVGVEVYSTDLLLKTPSWQNFSAPSQSVCEFTLTKFSKRKALNNIFNSTPFYTHQEGYKLHLEVYTNGDGSCAGTHISLFVAIMKGEYDDQLQWPFEGKIEVNMLNWREAKGHISESVPFNRARTGDAACVEDIVNKVLGNNQFCAHTILAYDPSTNTEYLQDDCLRIQVLSVEVYSTALVLKTPAWQDPLTYFKPLLEFTLTEFSKRKQSDNEYYSPAFYTHEQGYKICIKVIPNGNGSGKGSHISVFFYHMKEEHDDLLHWPFQGDVVLEILNWREDKGHYKKRIECTGISQYTNQVTETNMASGGWGEPKYILHTSLIYDPTTNIEYVQDDCLRLRVSTVNVYSGPLMLKTPAWQDSPATTKPLLECTLTELTKRKELEYKFISSEAFYSHTQEYKLVLLVVFSASIDGIVICAMLLNGDHDEKLEWPAKFNFTIELLNWRENKKHRKATATGPTNKTSESVIIQGSKLSIPYSSLLYDPLTNTEYLQDDCLRLRVLNNN